MDDLGVFCVFNYTWFLPCTWSLVKYTGPSPKPPPLDSTPTYRECLQAAPAPRPSADVLGKEEGRAEVAGDRR